MLHLIHIIIIKSINVTLYINLSIGLFKYDKVKETLSLRRPNFCLRTMVIGETKRITSSTIASQSYANLFNLINNRTNVPLPEGIPSDHPFVVVREPRIGRKFRGFPFIIIQRSKPTKGKSTVSLTKSFMSYDFTLRVVTRDEDADGTGIPVGSEQCNTITDNIIKTLNDATNRKSLINHLMGKLEYDIDTDEEEFFGEEVFISEFDIRFENTLITTT